MIKKNAIVNLRYFLVIVNKNKLKIYTKCLLLLRNNIIMYTSSMKHWMFVFNKLYIIVYSYDSQFVYIRPPDHTCPRTSNLQRCCNVEILSVLYWSPHLSIGGQTFKKTNTLANILTLFGLYFENVLYV